MRLVLLGLNVIVLVLLGAYLLDLFGMKALGMNTVGMMFVASVAALLMVNHLVEKMDMRNPLMYIVPGLIAVVAPIVAIRQLSIVSLMGVLLTVPGIVLFVRQSIK